MNNFSGKRGKEIKKLGGIINSTVKTLKAKKRENSSLREIWEKVTSSDILVHTEVEGIKGCVLYVEVDSATWLHNIVAFRKSELLKLMQDNYKRKFISDIRFRIGTVRKDT